MRKRIHARGFIDLLLPAALSFIGGSQRNDANQDINTAQMAFNKEEAEKNRTFQSEQSEITRGYNSAEAQKNRDFQDEQSSTVWQRGVKDMEAAGINPMLAYMKGGAPMSSGSSASSAAASGSQANSGSLHRMEDVIGPAVNSAVNAQLGIASAEKIRAETKNVEADTLTKLITPDKIKADTDVSLATATNVRQTTMNLEQEFWKINHSVDLLKEQIKTEPQRRYNIQAERDLNEIRWDLTKAQTMYEQGKIPVQDWQKELTRAKAIIETLRIKREQNLHDAEFSTFKEKVSPFLDDARKITDGVEKYLPWNKLDPFSRDYDDYDFEERHDDIGERSSRRSRRYK